jgi:hypothetical protein
VLGVDCGGTKKVCATVEDVWYLQP